MQKKMYITCVLSPSGGGTVPEGDEQPVGCPEVGASNSASWTRKGPHCGRRTRYWAKSCRTDCSGGAGPALAHTNGQQPLSTPKPERPDNTHNTHSTNTHTQARSAWAKGPKRGKPSLG